MILPISLLGPGQLKDIEASEGNWSHGEYERLCTVIKQSGGPPGGLSKINDQSPFRMAKLFGGHWTKYNRHYVVQVAGCGLDCWYCYVDNLNDDLQLTPSQLVDDFAKSCTHRGYAGVFHLMGGMPARYPMFWRELRQGLDSKGFNDVVILSDVTFLEWSLFGVKPWRHMDVDRLLISGCLKGTSITNFKANTGSLMFRQACNELLYYEGLKNFYVTLLLNDVTESPRELIPFRESFSVDTLRFHEYEVVRSKNKFTSKETEEVK